MTQRVMNFGAGPAALPLPVLEQIREEWLDFAGTGKSVVETSHRSPEYDAVHESGKQRMLRLLGLGDDYQVLYCAGGATMQFSMIAQNLLGPNKHADYIITGSWSKKALSEAKPYGEVRTAATSADIMNSAPRLAVERDLDHPSCIAFLTPEAALGLPVYARLPDFQHRYVLVQSLADFNATAPLLRFSLQ